MDYLAGGRPNRGQPIVYEISVPARLRAAAIRTITPPGNTPQLPVGLQGCLIRNNKGKEMLDTQGKTMCTSFRFDLTQDRHPALWLYCIARCATALISLRPFRHTGERR